MDTLASPFELKSIDDAGHIEGLAAAFGNVDHGRDRIMPGAFTKTLAGRNGNPIPMLLHHKLDRPAGAWTDWKQTDAGLEVKGRLALGSRDGTDAHALTKTGALRGLSIGFETVRKSHVGDVRQLHEVALHEISLTPIGLNNLATVRSVKSVLNIGDLRDLLHDHGFSNREAKAMAGAAWKARTDAEGDELSLAEAEIHEILTNSAARIAALSKGN